MVDDIRLDFDIDTTDTSEYIQSIVRLTRDLREAASTMTAREARFLVDIYYQIQRQRIRGGNQETASDSADEPHRLISWVREQQHTLEKSVRSAMDTYSDSQVIGRWSKTICGIGPITSAGLMAHIDIEKAPTFGHILRFAGLDPTCKWLNEAQVNQIISDLEHKKGEVTDTEVAIAAGKAGRKPDNLKRLALRMSKSEDTVTLDGLHRALKLCPWNQSLKTLCWKIGVSFMKQQGRESDIYGKVYKARREWEVAQNDQGAFAPLAETKLATTNIGKTTEAYKWYSQGMLPPARILLRSLAHTEKLFLSHWHHVAWESHYGTPPPYPYVHAIMGHTTYMPPPNWPMK